MTLRNVAVLTCVLYQPECDIQRQVVHRTHTTSEPTFATALRFRLQAEARSWVLMLFATFDGRHLGYFFVYSAFVTPLVLLPQGGKDG